MATIQIDLPPTKSYSARCVYWIPADGDTVTHGDGDDQHQLAALGKIGLTVVKGKIGFNVAIDTQVYALQPLDTGSSSQVAFMLLKLTAPGEAAECYEVTGGAAGRKCSCPAGASRKACKHLDGVAALVAARHLPGPKKAR